MEGWNIQKNANPTWHAFFIVSDIRQRQGESNFCQLLKVDTTFAITHDTVRERYISLDIEDDTAWKPNVVESETATGGDSNHRENNNNIKLVPTEK